jgi:uncharacterized membrane protein
MGAVEPAAASSREPGVSVLGRARAWSAASRWDLVVSAGMVAWSAVLFATVRSEYSSFRLGRFDLGNMTQAVWSTAHGRPLDVTLIDGDQAARLAFHVDPILVLLSPLWIVAPSPLTLAAVQIAAMALGALPVYWLGRRYLGSERPAALLALAYLAYPWLSWNALDAIHPVTLAVPLFLYCVYFLDGERPWAALPFAILVLATGELMGFFVAVLGVWYALAHRRRVAGLALVSLGVGWSILAIYVVVPMFADGSSPYFGYYASVGGSPVGVLKTAVTDPGAIASALFTGDLLRYVFGLGVPLVGLFVLAPGLAAVALPQILASGLSDSEVMTEPRHHYTAAVIPFLVAATVIGIARLPVPRRAFAAALVLAASATLSLTIGAWSFALRDNHFWYGAQVPAARRDALRAAVALVPGDAAVSSTNKAGSHLSARRYVYSAPVLGGADWIVLDMADPFVPAQGSPVLERRPDVLRAFRRRIERSPSWERVFESSGVLVFRRSSAD